MDIETFREYCLSLGDVEEKLPFAKIAGGESVLAFYVNGHTFCYCNIDDFKTVIVKSQPERIPKLIETTQGMSSRQPLQRQILDRYGDSAYGNRNAESPDCQLIRDCTNKIQKEA